VKLSARRSGKHHKILPALLLPSRHRSYCESTYRLKKSRNLALRLMRISACSGSSIRFLTFPWIIHQVIEFIRAVGMSLNELPSGGSVRMYLLARKALELFVRVIGRMPIPVSRSQILIQPIWSVVSDIEEEGASRMSYKINGMVRNRVQIVPAFSVDPAFPDRFGVIKTPGMPLRHGEPIAE